MLDPKEAGKRIKDLLNGWDEFDADMKRVSLIQMRNLRPSDRTLRIDADSLLYYVAYAPSYKPTDAIEGGSFIGEDVTKVRFKDYKQHFNDLVQDIVTECELASFRNELPRFKDFELVFTPSTNFRYEIFPEYKKNRANKPQNNALKRLKRWAKKGSLSNVMRVIVPENVEADDYVYSYAMKGDPVASGDKDVVNSVPAAYYYHSNHRKVVINTPEERARWILLQTLAGDASDGIPGLKGVALKTAEKLLPEGGTMDDVIKIYEDTIECLACGKVEKWSTTKIDDWEHDGDIIGTCTKCKTKKVWYQYTKDDAILTRRLVGLDQYKRGKVRLFKW